jgi:hypothetical protein
VFRIELATLILRWKAQRSGRPQAQSSSASSSGLSEGANSMLKMLAGVPRLTDRATAHEGNLALLLRTRHCNRCSSMRLCGREAGGVWKWLRCGVEQGQGRWADTGHVAAAPVLAVNKPRTARPRPPSLYFSRSRAGCGRSCRAWWVEGHELAFWGLSSATEKVTWLSTTSSSFSSSRALALTLVKEVGLVCGSSER